MEPVSNRSKSKVSSDQTLLIINICYMVVVVITIGFFLGMLTDLGNDGTMRSAVSAGIFLVSDMAFTGVIIGLLVVSRATKVTLSNFAIPVISIIVLTMIPLGETYESLTGPLSDAQTGWLGIAVSIILLAWMIVVAANVKRRIPADATF